MCAHDPRPNRRIYLIYSLYVFIRAMPHEKIRYKSFSSRPPPGIHSIKASFQVKPWQRQQLYRLKFVVEKLPSNLFAQQSGEKSFFKKKSVRCWGSSMHASSVSLLLSLLCFGEIEHLNSQRSRCKKLQSFLINITKYHFHHIQYQQVCAHIRVDAFKLCTPWDFPCAFVHSQIRQIQFQESWPLSKGQNSTATCLTYSMKPHQALIQSQ